MKLLTTLVLIFSTSNLLQAQWTFHRPEVFGGDTVYQPRFYLFSQEIGYCVAGRNSWSTGMPRVNVVYKTIDKAKTWEEQIIGSGPISSYGIVGFGRDTILVALGNSKLIRTINGGLTWDTIANINATLYKVDNLVFMQYGQGVFLSRDYGLSFTKQTSDIGVYFQPTSRGSAYMLQSDNQLYRSTDTCKTWTRCKSPDDGLTHLNGVFSFPSEKVIYAKVRDKMYRSDDAGDSWKVLQTFSRSININSEGIYFINAKDGFHAFGGEFFKTNDSGRTWCLQPPSLIGNDVISQNTFVMHFENDSLGIWANGGGATGMTTMTTTNQGGPPCPSDTTIKGLGAEPGFNQLKVFPNPSAGLLTLSLEQGQMSQVQLFSMEGRLVFTQKLSEQEVTLQLPAMSPGIYMIEVQSTANKVFRQKLVIE